MKYVIFQEPTTLTTAAAVFPSTVAHAAMVPPGAKPLSAGFWQIAAPHPGTLSHHLLISGFSESLNIGPRPGDADILNHLLMDRESRLVYAHLTNP